MLKKLLPLLLALARLKTGRYVFSALTTVSAGLIALTNSASTAAALIACALFVSALGDYFMAHRFGDDRTYVFGVGGFFAGGEDAADALYLCGAAGEHGG